MKTTSVLKLLSLLSLFFLSLSFRYQNHEEGNQATKSDTSSNYLDGTYEGYSRDGYTSENFWGHIRLTLSGGAFTDIWFTIRDSSSHEPVDSMYGVNHYSGNPIYMQQCVEDGHGIEDYPQVLLEAQNFDDVDAVSGATWSYNIFIATAHEALKEAEKPNLTSDSRNLLNMLEFQVRPNPFGSSLSVEYNLSEPIFINIRIYDSRGHFVKELENMVQNPGPHAVNWNGYLPSGIYYCCLRSGSDLICRKLIKL
jgi:major membrane immunogen (membrane-anchored lipoprotein)